MKWRPRLDWAHQIGLTTPRNDVLIVDEDAHGKGLKIVILKMFLNVKEEQIEIWQNGWHDWIERMK